MAWTDDTYKLQSGASAPEEGYLQYPKAGFGTRFVAYLLDWLLLLPSIFILMVWLAIVADLVTINFEDEFILIVGLFIVIGYRIYFEGSKGATPGKMIMNLKVITTDGKTPIGYSRAFVRWIGRVISIIVFWGVIWIAIDGDKQGWHDKIANTYVVKVGKEPRRLVEEEVRPKQVNILIKIICVSMFCAIILIVLRFVVGEILVHIMAIVAYSLILSYYFFKLWQESTKKS